MNYIRTPDPREVAKAAMLAAALKDFPKCK